MGKPMPTIPEDNIGKDVNLVSIFQECSFNKVLVQKRSEFGHEFTWNLNGFYLDLNGDACSLCMRANPIARQISLQERENWVSSL